MRAFNVLGTIALVNFPRGTKAKEKKQFAQEILNKHKTIKTVLEKSGDFKGRLRKMKVKHLLGERNLEVLYKENNCIFRFNIEETYFSPRLSNERKEIAKEIHPNESVLVMFSGVAPFPIVIAKQSPAKVVYANEINRKANTYAKENIERNKLQERVILTPGDIKKVTQKMKGKTFDVIVMPRPQLKDTFLKEAFALSKKGTRIYYYDFCKREDKEKIIEKVKEEAKKNKKKITILQTKEAGEIAPYKIRIRIDLKVQ